MVNQGTGGEVEDRGLVGARPRKRAEQHLSRASPGHRPRLHESWDAAATGVGTTEASLKAEVVALRAHVVGLEGRLRALEQSWAQRGLSRKEESFDGAALRVARLAAGWSLDDIAIAVGVTRGCVSRWEVRPHAVPRWRAEQVTEAFRSVGVTPPAWDLQ